MAEPSKKSDTVERTERFLTEINYKSYAVGGKLVFDDLHSASTLLKELTLEVASLTKERDSATKERDQLREEARRR
jgi:hypothetical protein